MNILYGALTAVVGYLIGSVSTGIIIAAYMKKGDIRKEGSKNIGATNVQRVLGNMPGALTLIGDALKAVIACLIGQLLLGHTGAMIGGLAAIIGHNWPIYYGFHGGKGVSCSAGVILFTYPLFAVFCAIAFTVTVLLTKFVSLGSMVTLVVFFLLVFFTNLSHPLTWLWALVMLLLCVYRHRENIKRLLNGTENKFGQKKAAK